MTENRRNYYRVLHVQPEAPIEVIKASYRTLMSTLRQHPDLGGDTAAAQLLNEAYEVLSDPQRRAAYDRELVAHWQRVRERAAASKAAAEAKAEAAARSAQAPVADEVVAETGCPVCRFPLPSPIHIDTRCIHCDAPLASLPANDAAAHELLGRRGSVRRDRTQVATMYVGWPSTRMPVRWRDLSLTGLSVYSAQPIPAGQTVRVVDSALDVVARVVSCRASGQAWSVHGRLLTAIFTQTAGVFVSAKA
jgi:hypothetical protein